MALQLLKADATFDVLDSELPDVANGDPETVYTVRTITREVRKQITDPHTKQTRNGRTGAREEIVDFEAVLDDLLDYALVKWAGVVEDVSLPKDQHVAVPCTRAAKLQLDYQRKNAIVLAAGLNRSAKADARRESFREPPPLV